MKGRLMTEYSRGACVAIAAVVLFAGCVTQGPTTAPGVVLFHSYEQRLPAAMLAGATNVGSTTEQNASNLSNISIATLKYGDRLAVEFAMLTDSCPAQFEAYARNGMWPKGIAALDPALVTGDSHAAWFAAGVCHEMIADNMYVLEPPPGTRGAIRFSQSEAILDAVAEELTAAYEHYRHAALLHDCTRYRACSDRVQEKLAIIVERHRQLSSASQ